MLSSTDQTLLVSTLGSRLGILLRAVSASSYSLNSLSGRSLVSATSKDLANRISNHGALIYRWKCYFNIAQVLNYYVQQMLSRRQAKVAP
jgi:hypothetical protein